MLSIWTVLIIWHQTGTRTIARCRTIFAANCAGVSDAPAPDQRPQAPLVTAGLGSLLPFLPPAASAAFASFHGALHGAIPAAGYFQRARGRFAAARLFWASSRIVCKASSPITRQHDQDNQMKYWTRSSHFSPSARVLGCTPFREYR